MLYRTLRLIGLGRRHQRLGQVLIKAKVINEEQLQKALEVQKHSGGLLGQILVAQKFASEYDILQVIATHYRISATSLSDNFQDLIVREPKGLREIFSSLRVPISIKLVIAITFMIWVTILTLSIVILVRERERLYDQTMRTGMVSLNYFSSDAAIPLLEDDTLRLNGLLKESISVEGLQYASIVDSKGIIRAHSDVTRNGKSQAPLLKAESRGQTGEVTSVTFRDGGMHLMNISRRIVFSGKDLGEANVGISLDFIDHQILRESVYVITLSFFIVILGIAIAILIGVSFSRPISALVLATQEIGKGNFNYCVERVRGDEFGDLFSAFNYMSRELYNKLRMQKSFGSYVSPEILQMLMAQPEEEFLKGKRMEVTIIFTDIRGFTAYAEANEPELVVAAINEYFHIVSHYIDEHGGYVDKFIGDAVLGVFGAPIGRPDHARRALRASFLMQQELLRRASAKNPLLGRIGIGVNTGVAVAGDLGSEVKKQYSVIGDCVNVASRLNSLAAGGKIIISRATLEAARDILVVTPLPPAKFKGKAEPMEIFEVQEVKVDV